MNGIKKLPTMDDKKGEQPWMILKNEQPWMTIKENNHG